MTNEEIVRDWELHADTMYFTSLTATSDFFSRRKLRKFLENEKSKKKLDIEWEEKHNLFYSKFNIKIDGKGLLIMLIYKKMLYKIFI